MNRKISAALAVVVGLGLLLAYSVSEFMHKLDNLNFAVVQSIGGDVVVRRQAGWWMQVCPTIWVYPKAGIYICSNSALEKDALNIQFNNKSTALMSCQIGYRIDTADDATIIRLHQQVEGDDEKIWKKVYTTLNTVAQCVSSQFDPSAVIGGDKFPEFVKAMHDAIIHNKDLLEQGIDVNSFTVDGRPDPDENTKTQFAKQREADLQKRLAEAEKIKLEAETLRTKANYEREIAEFKGKADAETAKLVTEAERQARLANIEAQKRVDVEKLEKEQMLVKAQKEKEVAAITVMREKEVAEIAAEKERAVAEIAKRTEAERLEMVKLQAEQKIVAAQAKQKEIELSGAITEVQRLQLEYAYKTDAVKWEALGKGLAGITLPAMVAIGGSGTGASGAAGAPGGDAPLSRLIDTLTLEKLRTIAAPRQPVAAQPVTATQNQEQAL